MSIRMFFTSIWLFKFSPAISNAHATYLVNNNKTIVIHLDKLLNLNHSISSGKIIENVDISLQEGRKNNKQSCTEQFAGGCMKNKY